MRRSLSRVLASRGLDLRPTRELRRHPKHAAQTERGERAWILGQQGLERGLPSAQMLDVYIAASVDEVARAPPVATGSATTPALEHPGLRARVRRAYSLDCAVVIDTSLREAVPRGTPSELGEQLCRIGGYYSARRACVALASDSRWHEVVHEMVHLAFHKRTHLNARFNSVGRVAVRGAGHLAQPLVVHHAQFQARGYSEAVAEELTCREHELYTLRSSLPSVEAAVGWLLVCDNALVDAKADLERHPLDRRSTQQQVELRRILLLRGLVTSPQARVAHLFGFALCVTLIASALVQTVLSRRKGSPELFDTSTILRKGSRAQ